MTQITSGSDTTFQLLFRDSAGDPVAIASPAIIEQTSSLNDRLSIVLIGDGSTGEANVTVEGTDPLPQRTYFFRAQVTLSSGQTLGSPRINFNVV
jgi:hypothetical protein